MDNVNILGVTIHHVTIPEAVDCIMGYLEENGTARAVYTPNSEIIMMGYRDEELRKILNRADLRTADGIGVVYASRILKKPLRARAAGFDIACTLFEKMGKKGKTVYLFGSKPGIAERAGEEINRRWGVTVAGCADGYFDAEKEAAIIADINEKRPDVLLVCLGAPKQEKWIDAHREMLNTHVCMGLGGSLDVLAGNVKRAPLFFQKTGLEWFYRLCKEPKRIGRMMDLPRFAWTVLRKGKQYPQG